MFNRAVEISAGNRITDTLEKSENLDVDNCPG